MTVAERVTSAHESSVAVLRLGRDISVVGLSLKYGRSVGLLIMLHVHVMSMRVIRKAFPVIRLPPAFPPLRAVCAAGLPPGERGRLSSCSPPALPGPTATRGGAGARGAGPRGPRRAAWRGVRSR